MKLIQSILLICMVLFANLNIYIYQNWCHGENIGYTVNSKKFPTVVKTDPKLREIPCLKRDLCCKDVLIKSNEHSVFSFDNFFTNLNYYFIAIVPDVNWELPILAFSKKEGIVQLYSNPPPSISKLYKFYCRYTYYG